MSELFLVVAYDIPDDRRRLRVARILEGYGERLQYSVFECRIRELEYLQLKERLAEAIDIDADAVFFYCLCARDVERIERLGGQRPLADDAVFVGWNEDL